MNDPRWLDVSPSYVSKPYNLGYITSFCNAVTILNYILYLFFCFILFNLHHFFFVNIK